MTAARVPGWRRANLSLMRGSRCAMQISIRALESQLVCSILQTT
jgi:hypothetical protein